MAALIAYEKTTMTQVNQRMHKCNCNLQKFQLTGAQVKSVLSRTPVCSDRFSISRQFICYQSGGYVSKVCPSKMTRWWMWCQERTRLNQRFWSILRAGESCHIFRRHMPSSYKFSLILHILSSPELLWNMPHPSLLVYCVARQPVTVCTLLTRNKLSWSSSTWTQNETLCPSWRSIQGSGYSPKRYWLTPRPAFIV